MPTFSIIGSGGWGTAMACVIAQRPQTQVRLWCAHAETAALLQRERENKRQLEGVPIPPSITITADPTEATHGSDCWIIAVPTKFLRATLPRLKPFAQPEQALISLTKGIEIDTFQRPTEILRELFDSQRLAVISGPSHAEEVARNAPTSLVAASTDANFAGWIQQHVGGDRLRVYTNTDVIGVELAGALKNVLGIAAGLCDGLGYGDNAKAALLTRGLVEMRRFGVAHGAESQTFDGLAGVGDLITTCFSKHGRNRRVGERLAKGEPLSAILSGPQIAEGVYTAKSVFERVSRGGLDAPIMVGVYRVLYEGLNLDLAVQALLDRPQKSEKSRV